MLHHVFSIEPRSRERKSLNTPQKLGIHRLNRGFHFLFFFRKRFTSLRKVEEVFRNWGELLALFLNTWHKNIYIYQWRKTLDFLSSLNENELEKYDRRVDWNPLFRFYWCGWQDPNEKKCHFPLHTALSVILVEKGKCIKLDTFYPRTFMMSTSLNEGAPLERFFLLFSAFFLKACVICDYNNSRVVGHSKYIFCVLNAKVSGMDDGGWTDVVNKKILAWHDYFLEGVIKLPPPPKVCITLGHWEWDMNQRKRKVRKKVS